MYFLVKSVLRSLLLPPASPLILATLGAFMIWRGVRFGGAVLGAGLVSLWLLSSPFVADALWSLAQRYPALDLSAAHDAQAIVIIGGGGARMFAPEYSGPAPDFGLLERLSYGAYLAHRTHLPLMVSGAPGEALVMRTSLERDFAAPARWVENRSRDTYENARFSAPILAAYGITRIILVTGATHMWRAAQEFRDAGLTVIPAPAGVWAPREVDAVRFVPSPYALTRSNAAVYELIGEPARRVQAALGFRERLDTPVQEQPGR